MEFPEWADVELSKMLPKMRARGEGQDLEFKREITKSTDDFRKEVAAFATSNSGIILIGVDDEGNLGGIDGLDTPSGRDQLRAQIEGRCRAVAPPVTPIVKFLIENDKVVLAVELKKGTQPLYYSNGIPYVRHVTQAQPAAPQEVIDRVRRWLDTGGDEDAKKRQAFVDEAVEVLVWVIIYGSEFGERSLKPWVDEVKYQLVNARERLGRLSSSKVAVDMEVGEKLDQVALSIDKFLDFYPTLGNGAERRHIVAGIVQKAEEAKFAIVSTGELSLPARLNVKEAMGEKLRELKNLLGRAEDMAFRRTEDLKSEASKIGAILCKVSLFNLDFICPEFAQKLAPIGRKLHLIETMRVYMDGGETQRSIINDIKACCEELDGLLDSVRLGSAEKKQ